MLAEKGRGKGEEREQKMPHNKKKKPGLPLLIARLKRTALKAEAHVGCCHGTHLGDGSLLPKMAVLLLGHPVEINLSEAPSFLSVVLLSAPASSIYMLKLETHETSWAAKSRLV